MERIGIPEDTSNRTTYKVFADAGLFLRDLTCEIENARAGVDLQFFSFDGDYAGRVVAASLLRAVSKGIPTRLTVDGFIDFCQSDRFIPQPRIDLALQRRLMEERREAHRILEELQREGVEVKLINPLGLLCSNIFRRDHKKLAVIRHPDPAKSIAYVGGINLNEHETHWNAFAVKMKGDVIPIIQEVFNSGREERSISGIFPYSDGSVLVDARGGSIINPMAVRLMNEASQRIVLESPYFRGKEIETALANAVERHVDVSVIIPAKNHKRLFVPTTPWKTLWLVKNGIRVFSYQGGTGMTHAKVLLVDDTVLAGSSNFSGPLAGRVGETDILSSNRILVSQVQEMFRRDMGDSRLLTLSDFYPILPIRRKKAMVARVA